MQMFYNNFVADTLANKRFPSKKIQSINTNFEMLIFLFFVLNTTIGLKTLLRKPRAVDVGSVLIENNTDAILKVHIESNVIVSAFQATEVSVRNRTSSHGIGFTQDGFTTIRPRGQKVVKFTIPSMDGNSLVKCSIFTTEMVKIVDSETLENTHSYKLEKLGDGFILEPLGKLSYYLAMSNIVFI